MGGWAYGEVDGEETNGVLQPGTVLHPRPPADFVRGGQCPMACSIARGAQFSNVTPTASVKLEETAPPTASRNHV